jgi:HK97 family phage prohead protease
MSETLEGYAIVFAEYSQTITENGQTFREIIPSDCKINFVPDLKLLTKHDASMPLATREAITIETDATGVKFSAIVDQTREYAKAFMDLYRKYKGKMSFGFTTQKADLANGIRTLREITVTEISIVANPAYPTTTVEIAKRSIAERELEIIMMG